MPGTFRARFRQEVNQGEPLEFSGKNLPLEGYAYRCRRCSEFVNCYLETKGHYNSFSKKRVSKNPISE